MFLPQERNTDGTLFRNNSTPTAKVGKKSETSQLFPKVPKKPFTVEEANKEMEQAAKGVADEMNVGGNVDVLTSTDGLTGRKRNAKGWYDPRTVRITIVLSNHTSAEDVKRTIFHEAAAHMGLRQLVGEENFDTFIDNIHNNAEKGVKAAIDELANKNRLYVHEVFVADNIQNEGDTLQTAAFQPHGGIALYKAILSDVLSAAKVV